MLAGDSSGFRGFHVSGATSDGSRDDKGDAMVLIADDLDAVPSHDRGRGTDVASAFGRSALSDRGYIGEALVGRGTARYEVSIAPTLEDIIDFSTERYDPDMPLRAPVGLFSPDEFAFLESLAPQAEYHHRDGTLPRKRRRLAKLIARLVTRLTSGGAGDTVGFGAHRGGAGIGGVAGTTMMMTRSQTHNLEDALAATTWDISPDFHTLNFGDLTPEDSADVHAQHANLLRKLEEFDTFFTILSKATRASPRQALAAQLGQPLVRTPLFGPGYFPLHRDHGAAVFPWTSHFVQRGGTHHVACVDGVFFKLDNNPWMHLAVGVVRSLRVAIVCVPPVWCVAGPFT